MFPYMSDYCAVCGLEWEEAPEEDAYQDHCPQCVPKTLRDAFAGRVLSGAQGYGYDPVAAARYAYAVADAMIIQRRKRRARELDAPVEANPMTEEDYFKSYCCCWRCVDEAKLAGNELLHVGYVVCKTCGNKRCPKASDHELACTGSNEPGQKGSIYE